MNSEDRPNPAKIKKSFLNIIEGFQESSSGLFIKGVTDPRVIEKGDLEEIGKSLTRISDFLDTRLQDLEFQSQEEKVDKIRSRLNKALEVINKMGYEVESVKTQEPNDYHWYIIGALTVVMMGLFDYIEIHMEYINP